MDIKTVTELMREFKACGLTKLELSYDDTKIKMGKKKNVIVESQTKPAQAVKTEETPQIVQRVETPQVVQEPQLAQAPETPKAEGYEVISPMVGTVYTGPEPDADDFVSLGQKVKKGDVLCIIEAMKLMNEVEAEIDGEIAEILINNESMVEFGQPLFVIKP